MRCSTLVALAIAAASAGHAFAASYFVDFDAGNDGNNGTTATSAWKHSPGDKHADAVAKAAALQPGDRVIFKGGVSYRGTMALPAGGAEGKPIIFDGNTADTFGKGRAIIDGSEPIAGWKHSASSAECGGNPHWKNILVAHIPADVDPLAANLFENDKMAWAAQEPNLKDPFYFDDLKTFRKLPPANVSISSITDAANLDQSDPHAWDGARIIFWARPNLVYQRKVKSFDPAGHKLTFDKVPDVYKDRDSLYAIANHLRVLDTPGEFVISDQKEADGTRKIYYWPQTSGDPAKLTVTWSARDTGLDLAGKSDITIQGFIVQKQGGERATAMSNFGGKVEHIIVRDNVVRWCRSSERSNAVNLGKMDHALIEKNDVHENVRSRGLTFNDCNDLTVENNTLRKNGGTGICFFNTHHSSMRFNTVTEHNGVHANALTVYLNSSDILVFGNKVFDSNIAMTTQASKNITIAYNILTGPSFYMLADWDNCDGLKIVNNVILADSGESAVTVGAKTKNVIFKNNICSGQSMDRGAGAVEMSNNMYTRLSSQQRKKKLEAGSVEVANLDKIFANAAGRDYRLKAGSPAIDAGVNVGLDKDLAGTKVPTGKAVDIGAYEFAP
jgi:hypothetical protein